MSGLSAQHSPGHRVKYLPKVHSQQLPDALGSDANPKRTICWEHPALSNANCGVGRQVGIHMHQELLSVCPSPNSAHPLRRQPEGSGAKVLDLWLPLRRADEKQEAEGRSGRDRVKGLPSQFHLGSRSLPVLSSCFYSHPYSLSTFVPLTCPHPPSRPAPPCSSAMVGVAQSRRSLGSPTGISQGEDSDWAREGPALAAPINPGRLERPILQTWTKSPDFFHAAALRNGSRGSRPPLPCTARTNTQVLEPHFLPAPCSQSAAPGESGIPENTPKSLGESSSTHGLDIGTQPHCCLFSSSRRGAAPVADHQGSGVTALPGRAPGWGVLSGNVWICPGPVRPLHPGSEPGQPHRRPELHSLLQSRE